jgi:hypothetical protein
MNSYELHMKTHTCHDDCQNPICVAVREAVAAEREECAKVCEARAAMYEMDKHCWDTAAKVCAFAIRERGAP